MKLSDEAIGHIAKQLQLAILTGTDIVDNLRLIKLHESDGKVYLDPEYAVSSAENEKKMVEAAMRFEESRNKKNG